MTASLTRPSFDYDYSESPMVQEAAVRSQVSFAHVKLFRAGPLLLDCGLAVNDIQVNYHTYGRPAEEAVLVLHALTGDSAVHAWWPDFLGVGRPLDPSREFIICGNVLGGCNGSSGPEDLPPGATLSLRDMARAGRALLEHLGVRRVKIVGCSMGGMLAYAWLLENPDMVDRAVIVAAPARHSPWAVGLNTAARNAIALAPGGEGLKVARQIAILSYRSPESLAQKQPHRASGEQPVVGYLQHHGEKLAARFSEESYLAITQAMDAFQPSARELASIRVPVLGIGISSDLLYTAREVRDSVTTLPFGEYWELHSPHGHDAFLMDPGHLPGVVQEFWEASN
ncbi:homoserine O-acetyltransferase family protein [Deinococcus radiophilus]|uniref:Homoserine O-acetyltransferase n=1 Tax=Deinococcus radiophilus TaxID=32062 RepID=A0A431VQ10_9DEIO|nr:alpha/beta fold hydrolase [Deinococcus radiophilus]